MKSKSEKSIKMVMKTEVETENEATMKAETGREVGGFTDKIIMVTGASGFLGARIKNYFLEKGYQVVAPSHQEMDLMDASAIQQFIEKQKPSCVIHCAAISDTGECEKHETLSYAMNVEAPEHVAKACAAVGAKLIFCSSDQVYWDAADGTAGVASQGNCDEIEDTTSREVVRPHEEDDKLSPHNIYGRHKLLAEQRCMAICPNTVCLRFTWMYDVKQERAGEHGNFYINVKHTLESGENCKFPLHDYRGITYVWDVIQNLEKVMELPGGVYNYGAENRYNTYEMVSRLFAAKGIEQERIEANREAFAERPRNISMCMDKIKKYGVMFEDTLERLGEVF